MALNPAMSVESTEWTISTLSESVITVMKSTDKVVPLNLLQRICALLDAVITLMPTPEIIEFPTITPSVIFQCKNVVDLETISHLQVKIISGEQSTITYISELHFLFQVSL